VIVDGTDIAQLAERDVRWIRRSIGISLPSSRTAFGNIALPLEIAGHGREHIKARVESPSFSILRRSPWETLHPPAGGSPESLGGSSSF
jgi:D-methionine transport system ATP-binding protein